MKKTNQETKVEETKVEETKVEETSLFSRLTVAPVVCKVGANNQGHMTATNPLEMTDAEKTAFKTLYPSNALGCRALLTLRPCNKAEVIAFSQAVYGGSYDKAKARINGLFADTTSKMALRYPLTCNNGVYSVKA